MGIMTLPEVSCGFVVASLPVLPKFLRCVANSRIGCTIRSFLTSSGSKTEEQGSTKLPSNDGRNIERITDIEFQSLVVRSENSDSLTVVDVK
jgi:hypothetical protein